MNRTARLRGDKISTLPIPLKVHILSFLPTLDAIRTTVLSKAWKNVWASVTRLDFDDERDDVRDFVRFVKRVLMFRDSSNIQKFQLRIYDIPEDDDNVNIIDDWVFAAVWRKVVEFHLDMKGRYCQYRIPLCVFTCKTARSLRLIVGGNPMPFDYEDDDVPSVCFPNLKFLHVTLEKPAYELTADFFRCCPVVEDMIIDGCANNSAHDFNICAPKLKSLSLCLVEPSVELVNSFQVDAPNLEKLVLKNVFKSNYNLESVRSLVSASISFDAISASEFESFPACATGLLARISNVSYLSLSAYSFEVSYLPVFINLKKLDLLLHKRKYWELLADVLYRAPNLEDILLEDKTGCDDDYLELEWNPPEAVPICLSSHLKTITIKGFKGLKIEMGVARYLLSSGQVLNKLTLYTWFQYTSAAEMKKEFLMFPKAMSCEVEFIKL